MLQMTVQLADRSIAPGILMNLPSDPTASAAIEQTNQSIRVGIAVSQKPTEIVGDARNGPSRAMIEVPPPYSLDLVPQAIAHALIGIQAQHPVVLRAVYGKLLL